MKDRDKILSKADSEIQDIFIKYDLTVWEVIALTSIRNYRAIKQGYKDD